MMIFAQFPEINCSKIADLITNQHRKFNLRGYHEFFFLMFSSVSFPTIGSINYYTLPRMQFKNTQTYCFKIPSAKEYSKYKSTL